MHGSGLRRIAVVPAFNEEPTVAAVLEALYPHVDELVVVDDGSTDATRAEIERWMHGRERCTLLVHEVNRGMSEAYSTALAKLRERLTAGELAADDLVFTVDADGQHDLAVLDLLVQRTIDDDLDANLAERDLSYHGPFKKTGNWVVSKWASAWAGRPLHDVESGYRIFRLGALAHALDYYSGYKYSETVEVAVVLSRLGYEVRNDQVVPVPVSRSRTRMRDAVIDMAVIPVAATRVWRRNPAPETRATDAVAHLSIAAILAMLLSLTYAPATDTLLTLVLAASSAFGVGWCVRHFVPRPALAFLGVLLALIAAWLLPQRPDPGSAVVLAGLFGTGAALAAPPIHRPRPFWLFLPLTGFVIVRLGATRATLLGLAVLAIGVAALAAHAGRVGIPRAARARTIAIGSTLAIVALTVTGYFGASTVGATWFGGGVTHGARSSNQVAITFDDGPNPQSTLEIMRILDTAGVKATFFSTGAAVDANPQITRELFEHGHLVGNHSYHHDYWRWLDPRYPELERAQSAIGAATGACPVWFRPPHGQKTPIMERVVRRDDMHMALWDTSANDWATDDAQAVAEAVLAKAKGGSIILLHDGLDGRPEADRSVIVRALPLIIDGLRARGLDPVRLDALVGGGDYQPCKPTA